MEGETKKVYKNGLGHINKMAAKILFYTTNSPMIMKLGMEHYVLKLQSIDK